MSKIGRQNLTFRGKTGAWVYGRLPKIRARKFSGPPESYQHRRTNFSEAAPITVTSFLVEIGQNPISSFSEETDSMKHNSISIYLSSYKLRTLFPHHVPLQYFPTVICGHAVLEVCKKKLDIIS
tara:strand:- start:1804 stop:2175 length:372 start_codon:yes stop_codon:yes gene_type:complete